MTGMDPHDDRTGPDRPDEELPPIWRNLLIGGEPGCGKAGLRNLLTVHEALSANGNDVEPGVPGGAGE